MKIAALMKPKGFIKLPEFIFSIIAFSVLVSYSSELTFKITCFEPYIPPESSTSSQFSTMEVLTSIPLSTSEVTTNEATTTASFISYNTTVQIEYPFHFDEDVGTLQNCNGSNTHLILENKTTSKAIFFVFVGVLSFLFTLAMFPLYLFQDNQFPDGQIFTTIDFFAHILFVIFWFSAFLSWMVGMSNLKVSTT